MDYQKFSKIVDSVSEGDIYDDGVIKGKVLKIDTDGSALIEVQNVEGDVQNVTVDITDSYKVTWEDGKKPYSESFSDRASAEDFADNLVSRGGAVAKSLKINGKSYRVSDSTDLDRFVMKLLLKKKAECPKTGDWSIKDNKLFHGKEEVLTLAETVVEAVKQIKNAVKQAKPIKDAKVADERDERHAALFAIDEDNCYDLYTYGQTSVVIPSGLNTKKFIKEVLDVIDEVWAEVNPFEKDLDLDYMIDGNILRIKVKRMS